ncbi:hypothetical protein P3T76_015422 [Phytophthora citrophthora]|uniref:HNH nuclease domain-containing protein n=1 Tax=Phytophthora citrophthora TaxID=4793 RepID=A0AAD9FZE5_9STRA|nr:hypothetical protein P3T76_015422 [Phytophthora citrophthora]
MLFDIAFPQSLVFATHLFRRSNEYLASVLMHISDIDDVKNGLLLFQPLKHAFDHFQLSFLLDDTDILRLKLFDPTIRDIHLIDLKGPNGNKVLRAEQMKVLLNSTRKRCHFDTQTTYSDVDGSALTFTGLERPFDHCLFLQARLARDLAVEKHWIDAWYNVSPISVGYVS